MDSETKSQEAPRDNKSDSVDLEKRFYERFAFLYTGSISFMINFFSLICRELQ